MSDLLHPAEPWQPVILFSGLNARYRTKHKSAHFTIARTVWARVSATRAGRVSQNAASKKLLFLLSQEPADDSAQIRGLTGAR